MGRRAVAALAAYAGADFAVILAPALVVYSAGRRGGGLAPAHGSDLLVAGTLLGALHAALAWRWLRAHHRSAVRWVDAWIAAVNALVLLALAATLLLVAVLVGFAEQHAVLASRGHPVVALWIGVQFVAVMLAAATGRQVFRWLEPRAA